MTPPKTGTELRREALKMVEDCVCKNRQNTYGDAEDNFADIAVMANIVLKGHLSKPLDALAVALFSVCIKLARAGASPRHLDNLIDGSGYFTCGAGIVLREKEKWPNGIPDDEYQKMHEFDTGQMLQGVWLGNRAKRLKEKRNTRRREKRQQAKLKIQP